jgi:hypothetical protein
MPGEGRLGAAFRSAFAARTPISTVTAAAITAAAIAAAFTVALRTVAAAFTTRSTITVAAAFTTRSTIAVAAAAPRATVSAAAFTTGPAITIAAAAAGATLPVAAFARRTRVLQLGARFLVDDAHRQAHLAARVDLQDLDLDRLTFRQDVRHLFRCARCGFR